MRSFLKNTQGIVDLGAVLMIGIAFAALMVGAYIIWTVYDQLTAGYPSYPGTTDAANASWNATTGTTLNSLANVTSGFDDAVNLLLVAITVFILAIAISALLMLRGR